MARPRPGDGGLTGLGGGRRVPKSHPVVEVLGGLDELGSAIGAALAALPPGSEDSLARDALLRAQGGLLSLGAAVAGRAVPGPRARPRAAGAAGGSSSSRPRSGGGPDPGPAALESLDADIRALSAGLPRPRSLVLPGGCMAGALLHVARAACRRAERRAVSLGRRRAAPGWAVPFLNRLGALLFHAARRVNLAAGRPEPEWRAGGPHAS